MLFPTFTFMLGFLPVTAIIYFFLAKRNIRFAHIWLIIASFVFYSWFNWSYGLILAASVLFNWFFAQWLIKNRSKLILTLGIIGNVLLLGYFKYYDFFIENINFFFGTSWTLKKILLPLGISFFTFQQISFLILVYQQALTRRYNFISYTLFVCFFPQLIAGPIVLPDEMMSQFDKQDTAYPKAENIARGLFIFSLGLAKKILLADFFAESADAGFSMITENFFQSWQTAFAYTFQIYFDFSGYCDMAVGVGLLFNILLPKNFDSPYKSANITEFWRRWHITLGRFLMSTVYIPLGGNRCGKLRTCVNLLVTFFISGLWHGASWLFVLWGMLHGAALMIHRIWNRFFGFSMPSIPAKVLTFFFVLTAWVPFRAASWGDMVKLYRGMFMPGSWNFVFHGGETIFDLQLLAAGLIITFLFPSAAQLGERFRPSWRNALLTVIFLIVSMFCFVKVSPFIYFNF